jgi:capsular polysaccharide biosynthesis protein
LEQNLSVSPQQSAEIVPILANEGRKVMAIRNNNSLSNVQKTQEVTSLQQQSDPQLKAILSSAQYDKLKVVRYQVVRWVTQKRLGWQ